MIAGAGLSPAHITPLPGGYSATLWRVDDIARAPTAVLKRAASSSARITAERAALDYITRHAPRELREHAPRVLAADHSHEVRALLLSLAAILLIAIVALIQLTRVQPHERAGHACAQRILPVTR